MSFTHPLSYFISKQLSRSDLRVASLFPQTQDGTIRAMQSYNSIRQKYKPATIKLLLIAESPPPAPEIQSSRQFYYSDRIRKDDRLFVNTIRALYPETMDVKEPELEAQKETWLKKLQSDGVYMIEALEDSQEHEVTKKQRQAKIEASLPRILEQVRELASPATKIVLIKSNVFEVAAAPLKEAGYTVLNTELVDYPGRFNQRDYREKLASLAVQAL